MANIMRFFGKKRNSVAEESVQAVNANGFSCQCKCKCEEKPHEQGKKSKRKEANKDNSSSSTNGDFTDVKPQSKRLSKKEEQSLSTSCCGGETVSSGGMEYKPTENGNVDYSANIEGIAYMPVEQNSPTYNMNHPYRGKAVIFNFDRWDNSSVPNLDLKPRLGSKKDKDDLAKCFRGLDFTVEDHNNLTNVEFQAALLALRQEDHSQRDCLVVAIMTHGERNYVYLKDGVMLPVNLIWEYFEAHQCPTLAGKPKIFIVQACRGKRYDSGTTLVYKQNTIKEEPKVDVTDSGAFSYVIPNAADIIVAFSCPLGHYSWRSPENGSWFIQAICKIFGQHGLTMELQALLTTVAREVALNYSSLTDHYESTNKRQVTSTSSTLIRSVYFPSKPSYTNPLLMENQVAATEATETVQEDRILEEVGIRIEDLQMTSV